MIKIKQYKESWRLGIEEEFEFDSEKDFDEILQILLKLKKKFGRSKDFNKDRY